MLVALLATTPGGAVQAAAQPDAKHAGGTVRARAPAAIPYDELAQHVGERVVVHTTLKSTRVGVVEKVSKIELTLSIPTSSGPAELTLPKNTVARVTAAPPGH